MQKQITFQYLLCDNDSSTFKKVELSRSYHFHHIAEKWRNIFEISYEISTHKTKNISDFFYLYSVHHRMQVNSV